jgi:hypothetical protein
MNIVFGILTVVAFAIVTLLLAVGYKTAAIWVGFIGLVICCLWFCLFLQQKVSENIQQQLLEENKKQTDLLEKMQRISETDNAKLIEEYSLGYILFAIKDNYEIIGKKSQQEWEIDWNSARILALDEEHILFMSPTMHSNDGKREISSNRMGISREKGIAPLIKAFGVEIFSGVLVDDNSGIVCIIGLKGYK